jgi:hypothetical protein
MAYWWDGNPDERYWVEIRKLEGIGTGLECPDHQDNDGVPAPNPWYELVRSVRAGEVIYHYNGREQRFVGRSVAASNAVVDGAGGAYTVELKDFQPITAPIDLAYMRQRSGALYGLREGLRAAHPEETLYTPFQFRGSELYGMMSNYFAKLPRDVVEELFGPDGLAERELDPVEGDGAPADERDVDPGIPLGSFLRPFKPKADSEYMANVVGGRHRRSRRHERLVNECAEWLDRKGYAPMRNAAVDLGLDDPPVIIEAKTVGATWGPSVRQAVSQLYEYRYFGVASPDSDLIFLAEREVPDAWMRYLERDRDIGVMWPNKRGYHLSRLARRALDL